VPYQDAWELQERLAAARGADQIPDTLLLLEHPHTYTLGSSGHDENVLFAPEQLRERGIEIYRVNRGGDVTYHGPGQLVGYPILKLPKYEAGEGFRADVVAYVRSLEQVIIDALAVFGIRAGRYPGYTGVWVGEPDEPASAKIAAIGVKVTVRQVTMHGFALNVNTDLDYFKGIIPCGIADKPVTSMQEIAGAPLDFERVSAEIVSAFGKVFARTAVVDNPSTLAEYR
jgi:lipoyl(octanoyl) transferase